jgi:hypothetical protein
VEKNSKVRLNFDADEWLSTELAKYRKSNKLDDWKSTLQGYILSLKEKAEKPAEASTLPASAITATDVSPQGGSQQAQTPQDTFFKNGNEKSEVGIAGTSPHTSPTSTPFNPNLHGADLASICKKQPIIRDWLRNYLNSYYAEGREQVHTQAVLERKQQAEEFRKQALADRQQQEDFHRKKREEHRGRSGHVTIEQPNSGPAPSNPDWA